MTDFMQNCRDYLYTPNSNPCEKDCDFYIEFDFITSQHRKVNIEI